MTILYLEKKIKTGNLGGWIGRHHHKQWKVGTSRLTNACYLTSPSFQILENVQERPAFSLEFHHILLALKLRNGQTEAFSQIFYPSNKQTHLILHSVVQSFCHIALNIQSLTFSSLSKNKNLINFGWLQQP